MLPPMTVRCTVVLVVALWACGDDAGDGDGAAIDGGNGGGGAVDAAPGATDATPGSDAAPARDPLDGAGAVQLVQEGFQFLEGPAWNSAEGVLVFSDIPANTIYELTPPDTIVSFRNPSGNANGLAFDTQGRLLAAEHGNRRVSRTEGNGPVAVADAYEGDRLNSPNDVAVRSDGTLYFTDPPYGIDEAQRELQFNGVFRVAPGGALTAEWEGDLSSRPNGVALSPDEQTLYVADTAAGSVRRYDVAVDGSLSGEAVFTADAPNADGMAIDSAGNVFVTTSAGVRVFAPDGSLWGTIAVPRVPANCAFGGADRKTLYITARQGLYRVSLPIAGQPGADAN